MDINEHTSTAPLIVLIDDISKDVENPWGIACVRRDYLKPITNEAFVLGIRAAVQEAQTVDAFFAPNKKIYVVWRGEQKGVYKKMRNIIAAALALPGTAVDPASIISYVNPRLQGEELKNELKSEGKKLAADEPGKRGKNKERPPVTSDPFDFDDEEEEIEAKESPMSLTATSEQVERFREIASQRPYRKQLQILVAEDQIFSQKLLCEIIRSSRSSSNEAPIVDAVQGVQDGWNVFLKKAHNIMFVDLGLIDGSGHALARAVKELDSMTHVIIVTANNYEEELGVAKQNNVDGFIVKPYNKKQIYDCIDKYIVNTKGYGKGAAHGAAGQFR